MASYKTLGIIIKRRNINEADRLLTVMTERHGKVVIIAKGARRHLSKLGSHLEPYNLVNFVMAEGRNFDTLTGAVVEQYHREIASDLGRMARAGRFGEMVDVLTHDREEHLQLFKLMVDCLDYLDKNGNPLIDLYFFVNALNTLGYCPELYECVSCREKIKPEEIGWNNEHGGVICSACQSDDDIIDQEVVKILRLFLERDVTVVGQVKETDGLASKVERTLISFINHINQKELRCDKFWKSIKEVV